MKSRKSTKFVLLTIILLLLISGIGCGRRYTEEEATMYSQIFHAVPGGTGADKLRNRCENIETDDKGRTLIQFKSYEVHGFCIMQKSDEEFVYYYDNISYLIVMDDEEYPAEKIDTLKEQNDWNEELDENKMIKREKLNDSLLDSRKSEISQSRADTVFYTSYPDKNGEMTFISFLDYSQSGQEIFYIVRQRNTSTTKESNYEVMDRFLMILNADGTYDPSNYLIEIKDISQSNIPLAEIKKDTGWAG